MMGPLFYAKILLFGEYGIIEDSKGLSIPYNFYKGALKISKNKTDFIIESNKIQTNWTTKMLESIYKEKEHIGIILVGAAFKEDTDDLRNSPTIDIYNQLNEMGVNVTIYDPMIQSDEFLTLESFENLDSPHLIALMYPVKETLLNTINNIVNETKSFLYTPWQL